MKEIVFTIITGGNRMKQADEKKQDKKQGNKQAIMPTESVAASQGAFVVIPEISQAIFPLHIIKKSEAGRMNCLRIFSLSAVLF